MQGLVIIQNKWRVSIISRLVRHLVVAGGALWVIGLLGVDLDFLLTKSSFILVILYLGVGVVILSYTNPVFLFHEEFVEIKYPVIFSFKDQKLLYKNIDLAVFRAELHGRETGPLRNKLLDVLWPYTLGIFIPPEYKWVKIHTGGKVDTHFCFGLEYDYYDNFEEIRFETLKVEFENRRVKTQWCPISSITSVLEKKAKNEKSDG